MQQSGFSFPKITTEYTEAQSTQRHASLRRIPWES
jgi:hypothetical protein